MRKHLISCLLVLVLAVCLAAVLAGTAQAEKPVIDTISITSDIQAPVVDCYPVKPAITISPDLVKWNPNKYDWMKRGEDDSYKAASYSLVTDGKYRFCYGLRLDQNEAALADSVTVIINGQPQAVYNYSVRDGYYYFDAFSEVYTPLTLPPVPGSVTLSPADEQLQVGQTLSCLFSGGAESLDPDTLDYRWECLDPDTDDVVFFANDQGTPTRYLSAQYEGYSVRARICAEGYSGYLYSEWHKVGNPAVPYSITVDGGTADKPSAKPQRFVTITANEPPAGQVFDHWSVLSGNISLADPQSKTTSFYMHSEDVSIKAVFREPEATHLVNAGALTVRDGPDGERIGGLTRDDSVRVVETQGDWSKIVYQGGYGWVMSKYLIPASILEEPIQFTQPLSFDPADRKVNNGGDIMVTLSLNQDPGELYLDVLNENENWVLTAAYGDSVKQNDTICVSGTDRADCTVTCRLTASKNGKSAVSETFTIVYGSGETPKQTNPFTDVSESDLFYDAVLWAFYHEPQITDGMTDTTFGPDLTVTRGQCVTFLWRSRGCPEPTITQNPFVDVPASQYYNKAVLWAVENGITDGVDDTHFAPSATLSTAHIITFLYRTLGIGPDGWYQEAGNWAASRNLLDGTGLTVDPKVNCPRSGVVLFLYREQQMH